MPRPLVFLHLPKTAGQSIRILLQNGFPKRLMFPGTTDHHLAEHARADLLRYDLFAGHFSWANLDCLERDPLFFTVLRDPVERVLSFYRFLRREAEQLAPEALASPAHAGLRLARDTAFEDFAAVEDPALRGFILDNLDNYYVYYFATRVLHGRHLIRDQHPESDVFTTERILQVAIRNLAEHVRVYDVRDLDRLVADLATEPDFVPQPLSRTNASETADSDPVAAASRDPDRARLQLHLLCRLDMQIYQRFCA